jgi:hypothetical protein
MCSAGAILAIKKAPAGFVLTLVHTYAQDFR